MNKDCIKLVEEDLEEHSRFGILIDKIPRYASVQYLCEFNCRRAQRTYIVDWEYQLPLAIWNTCAHYPHPAMM